MRIMSVRTNTPLKTIEAVVDFQMQGANEALLSNYTVEVSGFGKFLFNHKKAIKKYEKNLSKKEYFTNMLQNKDITETKRASLTLKLENTIKYLESLKPRLDGFLWTSSGVEECPASQGGGEGTDRIDVPEEK